MDTFKPFFLEHEALYRVKAKQVWRDAQNAIGASWSSALTHACGGVKDEVAGDEAQEHQVIDCILNIFCEYFAEKEKPLSTDPYYALIRQCEKTERLEHLRKLFDGQFKRFKSHLIDQWRKKDGTVEKLAAPVDTTSELTVPLLPPPQYILETIATAASELAARTSIEDCLLLGLLLKKATDEEIVHQLGLSGPSDIAKQRNKLASLLQSEMHKHPELFAAEGGYDSSTLPDYFLSHLKELCAQRGCEESE